MARRGSGTVPVAGESSPSGSGGDQDDPNGLDLLSPPSYSHTRHTHNHSYDNAANDEDDADCIPSDEEGDIVGPNGSGAARRAYEDPSMFPSPPSHMSRPPARQSGLVADPNAAGEVRGSAGAGAGAVGRFTVTEGSPLRVGDDGDDGRSRGPSDEYDEDSMQCRRQMSPFPRHGHCGGDDEQIQASSSSPDDGQGSDVVREFYVPHFPSLSVNGDSVTLSIGLSAAPRHGVYISPSCSGLTFSPPKLKWTGGEPPSEKEFSATPLPDAREGKMKVVYCVGGDDASEYREPRPSVFHMYAEGTPTPLPLSEYEQQQQVLSPIPQGSESEGSPDVDLANGEGGGKSDRATFLAHGQPRQSGRFMVIDEEVVQAEQSPTQEPMPTPAGDGPSSPAPLMHSQGQAREGDDPLDLLGRLQSCLAQLMRDNERLRNENAQLQQENAELRQQQQEQPSQRNNSGIVVGFQQAEDSRFGRTAHINPHQGAGTPAQAASAGRPRFATMPPAADPRGVFSNAGATRGTSPSGISPTLRAAAGMSPPSAVSSLGTSAAASHPSTPKSHVPPVVMSGQKRASLPSNMGSAGPSTGHTGGQRASLPSSLHMQNMASAAAQHPASPGGVRRAAPAQGHER